jgi:hypothetical protein
MERLEDSEDEQLQFKRNAELKALYESLPPNGIYLNTSSQPRQLTDDDIELVRKIDPKLVDDYESPSRFNPLDMKLISEAGEGRGEEFLKEASERRIVRRADAARRTGSEYSAVLAVQFTGLVVESHLVPVSASYVVESYKSLLLSGRGDRLEAGTVFSFLEMDKPTGGIFNPVRARRINRHIIYHMENLRDFPYEYASQKSTDYFRTQAEAATLEFKDKYHEEP